MNEKFCIVIPAYMPGEGLVELIKEIKENTSCPVIVIDDGSGEEYEKIFQAVERTENCDVISYGENRGKGYALKKGFDLYLEKFAKDPGFTGVVTADADGQHLLSDILKIGNALEYKTDKLVLGVRNFKKGVPLRSKMGNNITIFVYKIASGIKVSDTQTGLRGIPSGFLKNVSELEGDRYEYEMNMLLELKSLKIGVFEVPIETVYIDNNSGSHFNTVKDSYLVYKSIFKKAYTFKYILSSLSSYLIDYIIYAALLLTKLVINSGNAQIIARVFSSIYNFFINKKFVFNNEEKSFKSYFFQGVSYFAIVALNLFIAVYINGFLIDLGVSKFLSQPMASLLQSIISFTVQKYFIFRKNKKNKN